MKANQALIDLLGKIGQRKKATDENIGAVAVELTPDDLRDIDSAATNITVHGKFQR
jgi:hypothetical protein